MIVDIFALTSGRSIQIFILMLAVGFSWMPFMKFRKFLSVSSLLRVFFFSFFSCQKWMFRKFRGSPVVRTQCFHCCGLGFNPWSGNQDSASHVSWPKYKIKINRCLILSNAFSASPEMIIFFSFFKLSVCKLH